MNFSSYYAQLKYLAPELSLVVFSIVALCVHMFSKKEANKIVKFAAITGLIASLIILFDTPLSNNPLYSGSIIIDGFSFFFKIIFLLSGIMTIMLCYRFYNFEGSEIGEIYYLILFAIVGMMFTVSSVDLITFYVSFETFAIISYLLAGAFKKDLRSAEAGVKYFILGILSSAIMLLGMAFVYGLTGETNFYKISSALPQADLTLALVSMAFFFVGLFFKIALVPFHMWTPDVYEGTPTPIVVLFSTAPKAATFAVLARLIMTVFSGYQFQWSIIFTFIAVVTMFWGNLAALIQNNVKRMMAFSSIAHAGYIMIGFAAWGTLSITAIMFYLIVYLFMNTAAFALIILVQKKMGFGENVDDLKGLARRYPMVAGCIIVVLLSLTGMPPTAGFIGKYYIFTAAVEKGFYLLAVAGALNSVISLFYYFRIGKAMFMETGTEELSDKNISFVKSVIVACSIFILYAGIFPSKLTEFISSIAIK